MNLVHRVNADDRLGAGIDLIDLAPVRAIKGAIRIAVPPQGARAGASGGSDGYEVDVTAFHVSSKLWYAAPGVQLRSLARQVADAGLDGRERPALLVGDANLWRTWLPLVLPGWRSTTKGATFPSWRPHSQIDHILVRGAIGAVGGEVLPYTRTSDHRAVWADLQLR